MAKATNAGLYVIGKLMSAEEITTKSGRIMKRLVVYFGDAKNLVILAPNDVNLPPEGASVTFPIRAVSVSNQGELTALLRIDAESNSAGGATS